MSKVCSNCGTEITDDTVKFCSNCGNSVQETAMNFCPGCGAQVSEKSGKYCAMCGKTLNSKGYQSGFLTAAQVLMVLTCVLVCWTLIPLAWLIPMTWKLFDRQNSSKRLSVGFKVCVLLFANTIAGILLLCDNEA